MKFSNYLVSEKKAKYKCECGWVYSPKEEEKPFDGRHADFKCPKCSALKEKFTKINEEGETEGSMKCKECGWIYDPAATGREFSEESDNYKCPKCDAPKSAFVAI